MFWRNFDEIKRLGNSFAVQVGTVSSLELLNQKTFQVEKVEKEAIRIKENLEDYKSFESGDQEHEFFVCLLIDLKKRK